MIRVCKICGKEFEGYQKTCSKECLKELRSQQIRKRWEDPNYRNHITESSRKTAAKQWKDPAVREKMTTAIVKSQQTDVYKQKQELIRSSDEYKEKISNSVKNRCADPVYRKEMSERGKKNWENEDYRSRVIDGIKKSWTPERRAHNAEILAANYDGTAHSRKMKEKWADPEFKELMRNIKVEMWKDLVYRALMSEMSRKQMEDSERRRCVSVTAKRMWADPDYKKFMSELSANMWKDDSYKNAHVERMHKLWADPVYKDKIRQKLIEYWSVPENVERYLNRSFKNSYKDYSLPSGRIVRVQGFENKALDILLQKFDETDVYIGPKNIHACIGKIKYEYENVYRNYYPDIYVKSINTIFEVKSQWTFDLHKEQNLAKEQSCLQQGFNFEFMIL